MKRFLKKYLSLPIGFLLWWRHMCKHYVTIRRKKRYGLCGEHVILEPPILFTDQSKVFLEDHVKIRQGFRLINNTGTFTLRKYSTIAMNCTVVTGNHRPTVGIPHIISGGAHINDQETDIVVEEGVWIGINVTLLAGAHIGRGAIVGACSLVNKPIPPYAVAVGSPARVIASVFTIEQILEHERRLYPEQERFSREALEQLFTTHFEGKKSIGLTFISDEDRMKIASIAEAMHMEYYDVAR